LPGNGFMLCELIVLKLGGKDGKCDEYWVMLLTFRWFKSFPLLYSLLPTVQLRKSERQGARNAISI
jgi:hypothetical protein